MLICHCAVVNDERIREALADGARDLLDIASATGAGAFCGACQPAIAGILAEATKQSPSELVAHGPASISGRASERRPAQAVARAIEEDLVAAGLSAGRTLGTESELATRYRTTRGILRQALGVLEHHGLVLEERGPNGVLLTGHPRLDAVADAGVLHLLAAGVTVGELIVARRIVEIEVARRAHERMTPERIEALRQAAGRLDEDPEDRTDFHEQLGKASGNPALALFADILTRVARTQARAGLSGQTSEQRRAATDKVVADHLAISEALASSDSAPVEGAVIRHLETQEAWLAPPHTRFAIAPPRAGTPMTVARSVAVDIARRGLVPGESVMSLVDLASRHEVDTETARRAAALLEYYSVASLLPGPLPILAVSHPDPWPVAQLVALHLDREQITVRQIREALDPMEIWATVTTAGTVSPDGAHRLSQRVDEEALAIGRDGVRGDPFRFSVNHNIHPLIAELSGNRVIALLASACNLALIRAVSAADQQGRRTRNDAELVVVHREIVDAITAGDVDRAQDLMAQHLAGFDRRAENSRVTS